MCTDGVMCDVKRERLLDFVTGAGTASQFLEDAFAYSLQPVEAPPAPTSILEAVLAMRARLGLDSRHYLEERARAHRLEAAPDVVDEFRRMVPRAPAPPWGLDVGARLIGVPVVERGDLPPGAWRLLDAFDNVIRQHPPDAIDDLRSARRLLEQ